MALNFRFSSSSPDPLGNSVTNNLNYSTKIKRTQSTTPQKSLRDANGNIKLQDFYLDTPAAGILRQTSPTKSVARTENLISPWRIHVTVEAERDKANETKVATPVSPVGRIMQDMRAVKVPLKGLEESTPALVKRGRGRPRKSLDSSTKLKGLEESTPAPVTKGRGKPRKSLDGFTKPRGTPHPVKQRKRQEGILEEEEKTPGISKASSPKKPKGRLKRGAEFVDTESMPSTGNTPSPIAPPLYSQRQLEPTPTKPKTEGERKAVTPARSITTSSSNVSIPNPSKRRKIQSPDEVVVLPSPEPTVSSTQSPKMKYQLFNSDPSPSVITRTTNNGLDTFSQQHKINKAIPRNSVEEESWEGREESRPKDPTDEHREYDSIIESEGFSMVTASSLPSAKQYFSTDPGTKDQNRRISQVLDIDSMQPQMEGPHIKVPNTITEMITSNIYLTENILPSIKKPELSTSHAVEETASTSQVRTSPSILNQSSILPHLQRVTPSKPQSSPTLPPPLHAPPRENSPRPVNKPSNNTPKLARVVRADVALQSVTRPDPQSSESQSRGRHRREVDSIQSPQEHLDDLFSGFGAGTRRELRAGLRLGEELAKRQDLAARAAATAESPKDDLFQNSNVVNRQSPTPNEREESGLRMSGHDGDIRYPTLPSQQLPSPEDSEDVLDEDRISWRVDTVAKAAIKPTVMGHVSSDSGGAEHIIDESILRREAEYQREREAVSKQIEEANTSQVIIIDDSKFSEDDDDDDTENDGYEEGQDDEEDTDIWQAEANSSDYQVRTSNETSETLFPEQIIKPRRSKLPSPWRRQNQVVYSDEIKHPQEEELRQSGISKATVTPTHKHASRTHNSSRFSDLSDSTEFEPDDLCSTVAAKFRHLESDIEVTSEEEDKDDDEDKMDIEATRNIKKTDKAQDFNELSARNSIASIQSSGSSTSIVAHNISLKERTQQSVSTKSILQDSSHHSQKKPLTPRKDVQRQAADFRQPVVIDLVSPGPSRLSQTKPISPNKVVQGPNTSPHIFRGTNAHHSSWFTRVTEFISPLTSIIPRDVPGDQLPLFPVTELPFLPLSWFTPWTDSHHSHLRSLYLSTQKNPIKYNLRWWSRSAYLRGSIVSSGGWEKRVLEWELWVVDEYMDLLQTWGVDDRIKEIDERPGALPRKRIDEEEVMKRLFSLWVGQVMRREVAVGEGGKVGVFDSRLERLTNRRVI